MTMFYLRYQDDSLVIRTSSRWYALCLIKQGYSVEKIDVCAGDPLADPRW